MTLRLSHFFTLTALFISFLASAQVRVDPDIRKKFDSFIELSNQNKWDQAFDLMYPKLFTRVPKQDLVDIMTGMETDGLSLKMGDVKIVSATDQLKVEEEAFVKLDYSANLIVTVKEGGLYSPPKAIEAMNEQFQNAYGKANVKWDEANKKFNILTEKSMMAIYTGSQWYLIEINKDQMELMEYLFPAAVMNTLVR